MIIRLGAVSVEIGEDCTITTLPDGATVTADHAEQPGQAQTALECGYATTEAMNRDHDLGHSILADLLGLECSPTLLGVAMDKHYSHWRSEEAAVLALQKFANAVGVDLIDLARRIGRQ